MLGLQRAFTMQQANQPNSAVVASAAQANLPRRNANFGLPFPNALDIGGQPTITLPAGGNVTSADVPIVSLKRGRVDNIVGGDASVRRARVEIGGTSDSDMAAMAGSLLGTTRAPIKFGMGTPDMSRVVRGIDGGALFSGFEGRPYDQAFRDVGPIGTASGPGMLAGLPGKPGYFNGPSMPPSQFQHTLSGDFFQPSQNNGGAQTGSNDVLRQLPIFQTEANTTRSNRTGGHAAKVKYTYTLDPQIFKVSANELTAAALVQEKTHAPVPNGDQIYYGLNAAPIPGIRIYDIVTGNWMMAMDQPKPNTLADVLTAKDLMEKYQIFGAGVTDEGHRYNQGGGERPHALNQRNIVAIHGGEAIQVWNYWGTIEYAQVVGFVLKGVYVNDIWALNPREAGTFNLSSNRPNSVVRLETSQLAHVLLQFVPWKSSASADTPSLRDLAYTDDFGVERFGIWIPFGTVLQTHGDHADPFHIERSTCSVASAVQSGKLTMIISRKQPVF
jgi:hypothetical protein